MQKVLILGYGAVGRVLTRLLINEKEIKSIVCGDIRFADKINNKKVSFIKMNVLDKVSFTKKLKKIRPDLVVNASLPKFNLNIMEACLKVGINYLDTVSFWGKDSTLKAKPPYKIVEQFDFAESFKKKGIIGLINSGVSPGLSNLIAAECASKLDKINHIKIRIVEDTGSKEFFFPWNKEWLLDEIATLPLIYRNGKFKTVESFSEEDEFNFPSPIGKRKVCLFAQDEVGSIPLFIKTKNLDVKVYDNNIEISRILVKLGLTSGEKIQIGKEKISPLKFLSRIFPEPVPGGEKKFPNAVFALSVEAIGKSKGRNKVVKYSIVFPNQKKINAMRRGNFISYPTALSMKEFILAIPKIKSKGVFPPECIDKTIRKSILTNLKRAWSF